MFADEKETDGRRRTALTVDEQCSLMARHGIKFHLCPRDEARRFLQHNTYFFKIKAFDKNFRRDENGMYQNLDFAYLRDLSTIDFKLRALILRMTGDIEHALRVRFNNLVMRVHDDGYQTIRDYENDQRTWCAEHGRTYKLNDDYRKSVYTEGMIDKYMEYKPIWLFWETCSLNSLILCYRSFLTHRGFYDITYSLLYGVRLLRNAASHHNCLLIPPSEKVNRTDALKTLLEVFLPDSELSKRAMMLADTDPLIHDLACVVISYLNLVESSGMREDNGKRIGEFLGRMCRHEVWYRNSDSGCEDLAIKLDVIRLLLSETVKFNWSRNSGTLSKAQERILQAPYRKPVRHGPRRASSRNRTTSNTGNQK